MSYFVTSSHAIVADNAISSSYALTASYSETGHAWDSITGKPAGLVSGSSQVDYTGLTNIPSDIFSGSHGDLTGLTDDDHSQYHTIGRLNSWVTASLTTANITEETNLYYTDALVDTYLDTKEVISGSMIIDSASYAITATTAATASFIDSFYYVVTAVSYNLPTPTTNKQINYIVKNTGSVDIEVSSSAGVFIDNETSQIITPMSTMRVMSHNTTNWYII